jgi:hypothetical protein
MINATINTTMTAPTPELRELRHLIHSVLAPAHPTPDLDRRMFEYAGQLLDLPVELRTAEYDKLERLGRQELLLLLMYLLGFNAPASAAA